MKGTEPAPAVRPARPEDIPAILELLVQVDMVHHEGRPDLFKGPATKYSAEELEEERRIFYVGMTRAKKNLCLFSVKNDIAEKKPSVYYKELLK